MNTYDEIIQLLNNDKRILACALGGSRSRQKHTSKSDYDIFCISTDEGFESFLSELSDVLETLEEIKIAVYTYYRENWGYMFKALSCDNESFDISIIQQSRVSEMAIRSTNKIIFDTDNIYSRLIDEAIDIDYEPMLLLEQKKDDYLKLFAFEYKRFYDAIDSGDYWYSIRCLERLKCYYVLYARAFLKIPPKSLHFPEKDFSSVDSTLKDGYNIDGTIDSAVKVCQFLMQKMLRIAKEKEMLINVLSFGEIKAPPLLKVVLIDMEYERAELNEPINVYVLLQRLSPEVIANVDINVVYRHQELQDNSSSTIIDRADVLLISSKVSSELALASLLEHYKNKKIILGGVVASHKYHDIVSVYDNTICAIGESETNLDKVLRLFIYYRNILNVKRALLEQNIPNLYFKLDDEYIRTDRIGYKFTNNDVTAIIHPDIKNLVTKEGLIRIEGSRGCPWNGCSFCVIEWKYADCLWREFPVNIVVDEIINLSNQGVRTLYFTDEDFLGNYEHATKLFSTIKDKKQDGQIHPDMKFWGSTSVFTLKRMNRNISKCLQLLSDSGVQGLFMGIESGSDSQLRRFNKGVTVEDNTKILSILDNYNFVVDIGFIMFDPELTMEELTENMEFIHDNGLDKHISRLAKELRLVSHTRLYNRYQSSGFAMKSNGLDIEYSYEYLDNNIKILVKWLREISRDILERTYELQADIRAQTERWSDDTWTQEIIFLRNIEYAFIDSCLLSYHNYGQLSEQAAESIYMSLLKQNRGVIYEK